MELLTPAEVATLLALSRGGVYDLCKSGELPCVRVGAKKGRLRIERAEVLAYLDRAKDASEAIIPISPRRMVAGHGYSELRRMGFRGAKRVS